MSFIVAIDGPAGSGKGSVTKLIAEKLNLHCIDTGAMYRCVALDMMNKGIKIDELEKINELLKNIDIVLDEENEKVFLNGQDVSKEIRSVEVTKIVSQVSAIKEVRLKLVEMQRKIAKDKDIIMEGRDITTVVFPNANVKIYLDADVEERARRRQKQNEEKNIKSTYEQVLEDMKKRDENDKNKEFGALKIAEDAIIFDSTGRTAEQSAKKLIKIIKEKKKQEELDKKVYEETKETAIKKIKLKIVKSVLYYVFYKIVYRIKVVNKEKVPKEGAYIICANHINMLDALAVVSSNKRLVRFICKESMFKKKILGWALKLANTIPINREKNDIESMKRTLKALKNGELVGIFPEGTRKGMEKNMKAKNGAAFFSLKTGTKVIPLGIQGSFKPFSKVKLVYGDPIDFSEYYGKEKDKEALEKVTDIIMDNIVMLTNKGK
ncbi:MAG: (d)CMP kinase [Clostridia bacterium]|nr:(d)CMP kinase [Clostridia bacterium]